MERCTLLKIMCVSLSLHDELVGFSLFVNFLSNYGE